MSIANEDHIRAWLNERATEADIPNLELSVRSGRPDQPVCRASVWIGGNHYMANDKSLAGAVSNLRAKLPPATAADLRAKAQQLLAEAAAIERELAVTAQ